MGDNQATTLNDPAANAPDAAAFEKGKGKAVDDVSMDEDEASSDEEEEESAAEEEEEDDQGNLEPISADNIIDGGRRTRGKRVDYAEAAEKAKAEGEDPMDDDEDEDDEDFHGGEEHGDDHMQE
ncbi:hypothetical protein PISL3812_00550 [Talaromyces islandicus]|uniref:Histone chaperone domain-containing protein n=1 Tax=Talaromyces islandicus TaxID=28573 RepID=A0A0U1LLK2_TALIS|nr:hypothetical protein PISL3812_00550 [Talaromyces islandicus]